MHKQAGFTLIEILMVMAILAILLALVIPGYQQTVRQSRRTEAVSLLTTVASLQQQLKTRAGHFTSDTTELDTTLLKQDYYQLSMVVGDETPLNISTGSSHVQLDCTADPCFKVIAVAVDSQQADTDCAIFTLDHLGRKRSYDHNGQQNPAGPDDPCW
ncbi:type IV pilin protein [Saccharospirillum sp. HFRX-1]|uniref:type IV pilin protein n=1 Tax=unclassified Saccharospirillum TaxID=2633430 RepID=UPI0037129B6A